MRLVSPDERSTLHYVVWIWRSNLAPSQTVSPFAFKKGTFTAFKDIETKRRILGFSKAPLSYEILGSPPSRFGADVATTT
jgi:hypothetical protein